MEQANDKYHEHYQAWEHVRDRMLQLSQLVTSLLIGNSFLVAAFAVMLGQEIRSIVYYVVSSVGIVLCIFLWLGISRSLRMYGIQWSRACRISRDLQIAPLWHSEIAVEDILGWRGRIEKFFHLGRLYGIWLPLLFIFMWAMLMVYAID